MLTREVKLTQGKVALVDEEDYEYLIQWNWCYNSGYAFRNPRGSGGIYLHRVIMDLSNGLQVDHINGDTLDNRKQNLRGVTKLMNGRNRHHQKNNKSGFIGVFQVAPNTWLAYITRDRKRVHLGSFRSKSEAIVARENALC